ncbi:MAG: amino acid ABC transporter ATP-binding protein [Alphaproteobacteria bacterium]|jgi:polar amino acid transport system ATP-binding protein|nr:amino acid ABC transporter ATP-binding protein [Alphaproteobacteria bacterium]MBT4020580.1 amino acid ABC transporter ATP-binding protein [Alphaproteobacteria bacterium]MBT4965055.1 amino acid ABC transporter ATP-binding protein [Alphaproteobacteria bacterium]MBT5160400.1 amino acid ABC transporter ATP-binding protein [Alphaproteobacteria bacterium]
MSENLIEIRGLKKNFGDLAVLKGIDMNIRKGQIVALIGASGSGKSTLLRTINQLEEATAGEIWFDGQLVNQDLPHRAREKHLNQLRREIGMVFQHFNLFPHLTAIENVTLAPTMLKLQNKSDALTSGKALLDKVGLADRIDHYPSQLSGGQKQRVAIARSLAMSPQVMLFDEVTSALDPELVGEVNRVMKQLAQEHMTMIIVTHDLRFAEDVSDHVVFLADGLVVEEGPPAQIFADPKHELTQSFLKQVF